MNKIGPTVLILLALSCGKKAEPPADQPMQDKTNDNSSVASPNVRDSMALNFIRHYKTFCDTRDRNNMDWIQNNLLVTAEFKAAYRKLIEDAEKDDPEVGLDFDPIFTAQDYPEEFVVASSDTDGYVIIKGKDWPEFHMTIKMKAAGSDWLVDGAGVVNLSEDKYVTE